MFETQRRRKGTKYISVMGSLVVVSLLHLVCRITSTVACDMDLTKYPMDEQECMLDLESCESGMTNDKHSPAFLSPLCCTVLDVDYTHTHTHARHDELGFLSHFQMATPQRTSCITGQRASGTSTAWTNWSSPSSPSQTIALSPRWWTSSLVSVWVVLSLWFPARCRLKLLPCSSCVMIPFFPPRFLHHVLFSGSGLSLTFVFENSANSFWKMKDVFSSDFRHLGLYSMHWRNRSS